MRKLTNKTDKIKTTNINTSYNSSNKINTPYNSSNTNKLNLPYNFSNKMDMTDFYKF